MLARFVDSRRLNAGLVVVLGLTLPLVFPFGAAAAGLSALKRGVVEGALLCLVAWGCVAGLMLVLGGGTPIAMTAMLALLLMVVGLCGVLRATNSLELTMLSALAVTLAGLSLLLVSMDDPVAYWRTAFGELIDQWAAAGRDLGTTSKEQVLERLQLEAFTGNVMATLLLLGVSCVFLARSWQAQLVNPGGFRRAFYALQLGRTLAAVTALCFMTTVLVQWLWLVNVAAVLLWLWIIQGLSVIHAIVGGLKASSGWLFATYLGLFLGWPMGIPVVLLVPLLGLVNQFYDLRAAVLERAGKN